jgi:hypothetical protein
MIALSSAVLCRLDRFDGSKRKVPNPDIRLCDVEHTLVRQAFVSLSISNGKGIISFLFVFFDNFIRSQWSGISVS